MFEIKLFSIIFLTLSLASFTFEKTPTNDTRNAGNDDKAEEIHQNDDSFFEMNIEEILSENGLIEAYLEVPDNGTEMRRPDRVVLAVVMGIITAVGLIANGLVFFVMIAGNEIGNIHEFLGRW